MARRRLPEGVRMLARADMAGESWSVELLFDSRGAEDVAKAAVAGRKFVDAEPAMFGVVARAGRGGRPREFWFAAPNDALETFQEEIGRLTEETR